MLYLPELTSARYSYFIKWTVTCRMETLSYQNTSLTLDVYQTDDLRKWIGIYLHACKSRNLAVGTIEFYAKKLNAFTQFGLKHAITNISQIRADPKTFSKQELFINFSSNRTRTHNPKVARCAQVLPPL